MIIVKSRIYIVYVLIEIMYISRLVISGRSIFFKLKDNSFSQIAFFRKKGRSVRQYTFYSKFPNTSQINSFLFTFLSDRSCKEVEFYHKKTIDC